MAVGISGDHVLVGSTRYGPDELGIDYLGAVYTYEAPLTAWVDTTETALFSNPVRLHASQNKFGNAVDIDGDYTLIGAHRKNHDDLCWCGLLLQILS